MAPRIMSLGCHVRGESRGRVYPSPSRFLSRQQAMHRQPCASQLRRFRVIPSRLARTPHQRGQAYVRGPACPDTEEVTDSNPASPSSKPRPTWTWRCLGQLPDSVSTTMATARPVKTGRSRPAATPCDGRSRSIVGWHSHQVRNVLDGRPVAQQQEHETRSPSPCGAPGRRHPPRVALLGICVIKGSSCRRYCGGAE
jgi:hypothetical protein